MPMPLGGTDFFREIARRYLPQPQRQSSQLSGYTDFFRKGSPAQGMWTFAGFPSNGLTYDPRPRAPGDKRVYEDFMQNAPSYMRSGGSPSGNVSVGIDPLQGGAAHYFTGQV